MSPILVEPIRYTRCPTSPCTPLLMQLHRSTSDTQGTTALASSTANLAASQLLRLAGVRPDAYAMRVLQLLASCLALTASFAAPPTQRTTPDMDVLGCVCAHGEICPGCH
jgi:hypothetical protein